MTKQRGVTIVVHTDGDLNSRQYRLPVWAFEAGKWAALVFGLLVVLFFAFAGPITRAAGRVPGLDREVARLRAENGRVQQLAAALSRAEQNYQQLHALLGGKAPVAGDATTRAAGGDSTPGGGGGARKAGTIGSGPTAISGDSADLPRAISVQARAPGASPRYETGPSTPAHWPLDVAGFVTRGQVRAGDPAESHPGIDVAVPIGTAVRAAGGGTVQAAGTDPDYGLYVLLRHPGRYETMYGHASRLLVREGDEVAAGQVIALTGSSGRSTAPHLHFEIRRDGKSLDPLTLVKEGN
jgi:murein DD-endopeptidase MepM/ murein hydrolase activator NlpD